MIMSSPIYLDNAATTRVKPEVLSAMLPFFGERYGNASSVYALGQDAKAAVDLARKQVAVSIGASEKEVFFTGSGSEADNWAVKGAARSQKSKGRHIITTAVEHHAVLQTLAHLEKDGFEVTYLPVDAEGAVTVEAVRNALREDTVLITVMLANNEVGTIQPIAEIGRVARERGILFHTDAVQAFGHVPIDVTSLGVDLLSLSAHKIYGPKGVGALYIRRGLKIDNLIHGGAQELGHRAGTENTAGIAGFGEAARLAAEALPESRKRLSAMRDRLLSEIQARIPHCRLNGSKSNRLCNNVNFSIEYIEGESLLLMLNMKGIAASSGSACTSGSLAPSHVLLAMGLPNELSRGSLRLSLGDFNTDADVDAVIEALPPIVARLREMSPLYEGAENSNSYV
jgi:cysteine desulfurase